MNKLVLSTIAALFCTSLYAMGEKASKEDAVHIPEEIVNSEMCRAHNHHFDEATKECIYCAHHLKYNKKTLKCEGNNLSPLGKCIGTDHFHAASMECMYCAKGFEFDESLRKCMTTGMMIAK